MDPVSRKTVQWALWLLGKEEEAIITLSGKNFQERGLLRMVHSYPGEFAGSFSNKTKRKRLHSLHRGKNVLTKKRVAGWKKDACN